MRNRKSRRTTTRRTSVRDVLRKLKSLSNPKALAGMARFGVVAKKAYGISAPQLKQIAKEIGRDHLLAQRLWASGVHEARVLAALIDEPEKVTRRQMESWAREFDSWAVVDGSCCHLFVFTPFAWGKAVEWSGRKQEFVKRAGFALMAYLAVHDKQAPDAKFARLLPIIERHATDERNFVKKAVNWALRQIGKRNVRLNRLAIQSARRIRAIASPAARWPRLRRGWVAADALRELASPAVQRRLRARWGRAKLQSVQRGEGALVGFTKVLPSSDTPGSNPDKTCG